jgi:hypothetical protein
MIRDEDFTGGIPSDEEKESYCTEYLTFSL